MYHTSTKRTPFQYLYVYEPMKWKHVATNPAKVASMKDHLEENKKVVEILKENLTITKNQMKQVDQHQTEREFKIRDWVFVRVKPYKQLSLKHDENIKLAPRFYGPYQVRK